MYTRKGLKLIMKMLMARGKAHTLMSTKIRSLARCKTATKRLKMRSKMCPRKTNTFTLKMKNKNFTIEQMIYRVGIYWSVLDPNQSLVS